MICWFSFEQQAVSTLFDQNFGSHTSANDPPKGFDVDLCEELVAYRLGVDSFGNRILQKPTTMVGEVISKNNDY